MRRRKITSFKRRHCAFNIYKPSLAFVAPKELIRKFVKLMVKPKHEVMKTKMLRAGNVGDHISFMYMTDWLGRRKTQVRT